MAYKEPTLDKAGARALMQALGAANTNIVKRHRSSGAKNAARPKSKATKK